MARENEFELDLGRIGSATGAPPKQFRRMVNEARARAGGFANTKRNGSSFTGARIGRGVGAARVLSSRNTAANFHTRRVIVKCHLVNLQKAGAGVLVAHLRYLQRDGVTRGGEPGELYDAERDRADGDSFLERSASDRHQFRFVVSADDGDAYDGLKGLTRRLMARVEQDLGTRLEWVAVNHYNTGHPHIHVIVRGKDETGKDLIIAREYIRHGMRERAQELVTLDLGTRTRAEVEASLRTEIEQDRYTSLDRRLQQEVGQDGIIRSGSDPGENLHQTLRAGRLQKLRRLGLAEEVSPGQWRLADDMEPVLRRMGERGDIIKTLHYEMQRRGIARGAADYAIYDPSDPDAKPIVGKLLTRGLSDEVKDRHFLIVDGVDGRSHYVEAGPGAGIEPIPDGSIVSVTPKRAALREVDRTVAEIAAANGGRYSIDLHMQHDQRAGRDFVESHIRRLEAMRRQTQLMDREPDGTWIIAPDHLDRALSFERQQTRRYPVRIDTLSVLPVERQLEAHGSTWLDRELIAKEPIPMRDVGFGREARQALVRRQQWLVEQDLAQQEQDRVVFRANVLALLQRRDLNRAATELSSELGLAYTEVQPGRRIEGVFSRRVDLASGRFAVIEKSGEFTLVPWRPVLERRMGQAVSGVQRGETISWSFGRKRSGPGIE
jgi:type IV secretory pathway VirD2 relaxase